MTRDITRHHLRIHTRTYRTNKVATLPQFVAGKTMAKIRKLRKETTSCKALEAHHHLAHREARRKSTQKMKMIHSQTKLQNLDVVGFRALTQDSFNPRGYLIREDCLTPFGRPHQVVLTVPDGVGGAAQAHDEAILPTRNSFRESAVVPIPSPIKRHSKRKNPPPTPTTPHRKRCGPCLMSPFVPHSNIGLRPLGGG